MLEGLKEVLASFSRLFQWWVIVAPWEQALRIRGGKRSVLLHPGIHFRIPMWDRIYRQSVRLRTIGVPPQTLATADGFVVELRMALVFQIASLEAMYSTLQSDDTLSIIAASAAARYVFGCKLQDIRPQEIEEEAAMALDLEKFGLEARPLPARVVDIAFVKKAYRLITGGVGQDSYWGSLSLSDHDDA